MKMNQTLNSSAMTDRLDDWNDEISRHLVPDSVILMIYLVVGILGNSIVIFIHTVRLQENWEERFFIPILAVVDLLSCVVSCSFSFSINMLPVKYSNDVACKIMFFLNFTSTLLSALMLVVIAINRHRKICKPFSKQMNIFWKKISIAVIIGVSLVMSWPCFIFYGLKEVYDDHTTGFRCTSIRGPWSTVQPLIFKTAVMLLIVFILVSLVVLYALIGRVLLRQRRFHRRQRSSLFASKDLHNHSKTPNSSDSSNLRESQAKSKTSISDTQKRSDTDTISATTSESNAQTTECDQQQDITSGHSKTKSVLSKISARKTTTVRNRDSTMTPTARMSLVFMLITLVFVVCYVPKVGMLIYESRRENFWIELSPSELSGYRFLYTAFIINNIVNPFIYGFLDRRFRNEAYKLCPCVIK